MYSIPEEGGLGEDLLEGGHQEGGQPEREVHPYAWGQRSEDGEEFGEGSVDVLGEGVGAELEGEVACYEVVAYLGVVASV